MSFIDYLEEAIIPSTGEQQNTDARSDAKTIIAKTRGLMIGRTVDADGNTNTSAAANKNTNAFTPDNIKQDNVAASNQNDETNYSVILKNTAAEIVYVTKGENNELFITLVNKQRVTKRTIALEQRAATILKKFI